MVGLGLRGGFKLVGCVAFGLEGGFKLVGRATLNVKDGFKLVDRVALNLRGDFKLVGRVAFDLRGGFKPVGDAAFSLKGGFKVVDLVVDGYDVKIFNLKSNYNVCQVIFFIGNNLSCVGGRLLPLKGFFFNRLGALYT